RPLAPPLMFTLGIARLFRRVNLPNGRALRNFSEARRLAIDRHGQKFSLKRETRREENHFRPISMKRVYFLSASSPEKISSERPAALSKLESEDMQLMCSGSAK